MNFLIHATRLSIFFFAGILLSGLTSAQDTDDLAKAAEDEHREHEANEIAVFIGLTHERRENGAALGLEYERRIDASLGIGVPGRGALVQQRNERGADPAYEQC